jgi:photosystem II stability/assembly factor-like uncharacterized protein
MKKFIFSFLLLSIPALNICAQQGWFWQNPLPQGNSLGYVNFWGNNGLVIGHGSTILKTSNNGLNWNLSNVPAYNFVYQTFVFDQNNFLLVTEGNLINKTTNGGASWFSSYYISGINPHLYFVNMQTGYSIVDNYNGSSLSLVLYKTINGGTNWVLNIVDSSARISCMFFPDESTGYLAGSHNSSYLPTKLLKTTNGGNTWDSITTNTMLGARSIYFVDNLTGFMNVSSGRIYKTTNGAASWDSCAYVGSNSGGFYFINSNTGFINSAYYTYKTTNCGTTWTTLSIPSGSFYYDGSETYTATGDFGSIYRSTNNGMNWINSKQSVHNGYCNEVVAVDENTIYVACDDGIILKTINGGLNWTSLYDPQMNYYHTIYFFNSLTGFAAGFSSSTGSNIKKTTNGGINWISTNSPLLSQVYKLSFPAPATGYAATKYGVFGKTTDSGLNWNMLGPFDNFSTGGIVFTDEFTGYWVGGSYNTNEHIRKTTNGGLNWTGTEVDNIYFLNDVKFKNENTLFICGYFQDSSGTNYDGLIFKSTNAGNNWDRTDFLSVGELTEISIINDYVYVTGSSGKILKSTNSGISWDIQQSCYSEYLLSIDFINQNTGYACSYGGIIIKTTTGGEPIGIEPISNIIPNEFRLYQNFPNPFNPVTKIKFSIPMSSQLDPVNIYIYDVTGREVKNYSLGNLKAGIYSIDFDGADFASGVYFCQLAAGRFSQTRKMVLIK